MDIEPCPGISDRLKVLKIHVSQRPAVCMFDNEALAMLNDAPRRGKPAGFGRLRHRFLELRQILKLRHNPGIGPRGGTQAAGISIGTS